MKIALTVEVDANEWAEEYGLDKSTVRKDVREFIKTALHDGGPVAIRVVAS